MINVIISETMCFWDHIPVGPVFIKDLRLLGSKTRTKNTSISEYSLRISFTFFSWSMGSDLSVIDSPQSRKIKLFIFYNFSC